jgi:hypothetical protein
MPFDPTKPSDHGPLSSAEVRENLNGLLDALNNTFNGGDFAEAVDSRAAKNVDDTVQPSNIVFSNPPTQAQLQAFQTWANALLAALKH